MICFNDLTKKTNEMSSLVIIKTLTISTSLYDVLAIKLSDSKPLPKSAIRAAGADRQTEGKAGVMTN